jgi:hypothetical protein
MTRIKTDLPWFAAIACLTTGSMNATEIVSYQELRNRIAPATHSLAHRSFKITTLDGKDHKGRTLFLATDHARLFHSEQKWEDIASGDIVRLQIAQRGRFLHHITESALIPLACGTVWCGGLDNPASDLCTLPMSLIFSPVWAYTAASAPFFLAADGIGFLISPKVYEIAH